MAISHHGNYYCYWHLVVKNGNFTLLLTYSGQEWQFHLWWRKTISHCYWHLVVKNGNFTFHWHLLAITLLVVKNDNFTLLLMSSGLNGNFNGNFKNGTYTLVLSSSGQKMTISHCYWELVVCMASSHYYWHLVIKNGNFTLLLTSSGKEWQFHIATDI